ncbi:MAG: hypothetical protein OQK98_09810 [Gammaproteobacteria bacterium]|nr:hypothetical protein [Gammaproteobacteria bacterium]
MERPDPGFVERPDPGFAVFGFAEYCPLASVTGTNYPQPNSTF